MTDLCEVMPLLQKNIDINEEESATANTANSSIYCSENVFIERIISMRMWPACVARHEQGQFLLVRHIEG